MARDSTITVVGNLGQDPELRYTPNGHAVANFSVAVSYRANKEAEEETTWLRITAWRSLAENVAETLSKGDRVIVVGRLTISSWETNDGSQRQSVEIQADHVGPSLQWASAQITRNPKQ